MAKFLDSAGDTDTATVTIWHHNQEKSLHPNELFHSYSIWKFIYFFVVGECSNVLSIIIGVVLSWITIFKSYTLAFLRPPLSYNLVLVLGFRGFGSLTIIFRKRGHFFSWKMWHFSCQCLIFGFIFLICLLSDFFFWGKISRILRKKFPGFCAKNFPDFEQKIFRIFAQKICKFSNQIPKTDWLLLRGQNFWRKLWEFSSKIPRRGEMKSSCSFCGTGAN